MCDEHVVCECVICGGVEFDGSMGCNGVAAGGWGCAAVSVCLVVWLSKWGCGCYVGLVCW